MRLHADSLAKAAYDAHYAARDGKNLAGEPLWTWEETAKNPQLREAWIQAAAAARAWEPPPCTKTPGCIRADGHTKECLTEVKES